MTDKPRPILGDQLPPIRAQAIKEILQVTSQFDWAQAKPIPREAIEDLMVLAYLRGAAYASDRIVREVKCRHPNHRPGDLCSLCREIVGGPPQRAPSTIGRPKRRRRRNK